MTSILMTNMQRDVGSGKIKSRRYPQKKIIISNIGGAPDVRFFDRLDNITAGETFRRDTATIGPLYQVPSTNYKYIFLNGRAWIPLRDPDNVSSSLKLKNAGIAFDIGTQFNEYYISYRLIADPALIFPHASGPSLPISFPNTGTYKALWLTTAANDGSYPDQVVANFNGGGWNVFGNYCQPRSYIPPKSGTISYPDSTTFDTTGGSTQFSNYQSGDSTTPTSNDAHFDYGRCDYNGSRIDNYIGNPYELDNGTPWSGPRTYSGCVAVQATVDSSALGWVNTQNGIGDFYLAIGANCRARVVASNASTWAAATENHDIPPDYWSNTDGVIAFTPAPHEHALGYYHVILGDGSVRNNVTAVDA